MDAKTTATYVSVYADLMRQLQFRESHYKVVGEITVTFSAVEYFLVQLVSTLISPQDTLFATLALKKLHLVNIIEIARSLVVLRDKDPDIQSEFNSLVDRIDGLRIHRNDVIHSLWNYDYANKRVKFVKLTPHRKKGAQFKRESFSIEELRSLGDNVASVLQKLLAFSDRWNKRQQPNVK